MEALKGIMTDNIIDGRNRFRSTATPRSILAVMERDSSARIRPEDRVTLASNLGEWAAKIDPENPARVAKGWFDRWDGDRWQKRKKFICFPGEDNRDPAAAGQLAANRGDWKALIEAAGYERFPHEGALAERDRENLRRSLLRGTKYVPRVEPFSAGDADAQRLMTSLAQSICEQIADLPRLDHLWEVLEITPFSIARAGVKEFDHERHDDPAVEMASRAASNIRDIDASLGIGRFGNDPLVRFHRVFGTEADDGDAETTWAFPQMRLGLLGFQTEKRIFVVPADFFAELRAAGLYDIAERANPADWVSAWLMWKGLIHEDTETRSWTLRDVEYKSDTGYGWTYIDCEVVREAWLSCRRKSDGSPGLWLSVDTSDNLFERFYPVLRQFDCLAAEAAAASVQLGQLPFHADVVGEYGFLSWPEHDQLFSLVELPENARLPGLLEFPDECEGEWGDADDLPFVGGWLDDASNDDLQNILFRLPLGARFLPSIPTNPKAPPICRPGTIAEALFANLTCLPEEQVCTYLAHAGERIAEAGLSFHQAVMDFYGKLIEELRNDF